MFALLIFPVSASIVLSSATVRWTVAGRKNSTLSSGAPYVRITYLHGQSPGIYRDPQGYLVDERDAEIFDRQFPPKEKLTLPGQLF